MIILATCQHETRKKHGKDRNGNQRWKCCLCGKTITCEEHKRPLGDMRISLDDAAKVLGMLLEGMSIRACERLTGIKDDTICDLILLVGENCQRFLADNVKGVAADQIELDEIWDFVGMKKRTKALKGNISENGDAWTWLAIDGKSKLVLAHAVGARDMSTCARLLTQLNEATVGDCQITSDGLPLYQNVPFYIGSRCSFAQLTKIYQSSQMETRYSPAPDNRHRENGSLRKPRPRQNFNELFRAIEPFAPHARSPLHATDECTQQKFPPPCSHD
jgi:transposase-like protein/IS1 family transposase